MNMDTTDTTATQQVFHESDGFPPESQGALNELGLQAQFLDLTEDAVWASDLDGKIRYWNKGAEKLYGWTGGEAVGHEARLLLRRMLDSSERACLEQTVKTGHWDGELSKLSKNQKKLTVHSRWSLVAGGEISPRLVLVVDHDLTEKKSLESQFLRAQRMEGLGRLASGIAHDLNNLLTPIVMSVPMLRFGLPVEEGEKLLKMIEASAKRGAELVRQLLTYGCGVKGERSLVDMGRLIADFITLLGETFPKEILISAGRCDGLWLVPGDRTQLYQVLLNLCVNARDAMQAGGTLSLSAENVRLDDENCPPNAEARPGRYLRLRVADTGSGIPPGIVEKIFEPFFTTKEEGEGSGLGLSTVARVVKSHGGFLDLATELGKGSRFDVYFPVTGAPGEPLAQEPPEEAPEEPPEGRGETILVVDDEVEILKVLRETLVQHNYRVLTAGDGAKAMAVYAGHQQEIGIVLTDLVMPSLDGVSLVRALKKLNPAVRIIAIGGIGNTLAQREKTAQLNELGVMTFLSKPFTSDNVLAALHETLKV